MNKAKQEAERLVERFNIDNWDDAKQCALICVDEMKKENIKRGQPIADLDQVKQAIQELN